MFRVRHRAWEGTLERALFFPQLTIWFNCTSVPWQLSASLFTHWLTYVGSTVIFDFSFSPFSFDTSRWSVTQSCKLYHWNLCLIYPFSSFSSQWHQCWPSLFIVLITQESPIAPPSPFPHCSQMDCSKTKNKTVLLSCQKWFRGPNCPRKKV